MSDQKVGTALRAVRFRRGWRQRDVAERAGVSHALVSLLERGHLDRTSLATVRRVAAVLDVRIDVAARWRGGELDRLLNRRHSALAESLTRLLTHHGWDVAPEVSFAIYGERGWIDLLAWHAATRTILVIEIKTAIVDVQEVIGVLDRKTRLARRIALERGWNGAAVATWLVVEDGSTNRRHVSRHGALLRAALPASGYAMRTWLRQPTGRIAALSFLSDSTGCSARRRSGARQRVRRGIRPS
jgi:transcriptional regulator with XRE-family HTH domain